MSETVALIPARLGSLRFPRKVLAAETGWPLIRHVWERAAAAMRIERVVIATDDAEVVDAARAFGAECVLTRLDHVNGTSRLAEAATKLRLADDALIVNVQGDEPEMDPGLIDAAVVIAMNTLAHVTTVASPFAAGESVDDTNIVKVVRRLDGTALTFSRAAVPHRRAGGVGVPPLRHVGIYLYRHAFLKVYAGLEPTPLEQCEMLEQLRVLEHGYSIAVVEHAFSGRGVDTPQQYAEFVRRFGSRQ